MSKKPNASPGKNAGGTTRHFTSGRITQDTKTGVARKTVFPPPSPSHRCSAQGKNHDSEYVTIEVARVAVVPTPSRPHKPSRNQNYAACAKTRICDGTVLVTHVKARRQGKHCKTIEEERPQRTKRKP